MNTVGKTLVIINLLFALATGAFLAIDFGTRTNWKQGYDDLKAELEVSRANTTVQHTTNAKLMAELKVSLTKLNSMSRKLDEEKKDYEAKLAKYKDDANDAQLAQGRTDVAGKVAIGETERLRQEVKGLQELLAKRDQYIIALEIDKSKLQNETITAQQQRDAAQTRSETILNELTNLQVKVAKKEVAGGAATTVAVKDRNQLNPPPAFVKGIVEKVHSEDRSLVQISIGSDQGIAVDHTLEVYRLSPRPEYLGMLRIVNADHQSSVGKMIRPQTGQALSAVRVGDEVASKIMTR